MTLLPGMYKSWEILFCHHFDWTISYTHSLVGFTYTFSSLFSSLFIFEFIEILHIMRDLVKSELCKIGLFLCKAHSQRILKSWNGDVTRANSLKYTYVTIRQRGNWKSLHETHHIVWLITPLLIIFHSHFSHTLRMSKQNDKTNNGPCAATL